MIKELILLIFIEILSIIYNTYLFPFIINILSYNTYNNIIICFLILIQIDNFTIYSDYKKLKLKYDELKKITNTTNTTPILKPEEKTEPIIEPLKDDKINGVILSYLTYISKKQDEIYNINIKKKHFNRRISKSYNNLNEA